MVAVAPLFSVVIPTYARPERLAACLDALTALDYPRDRFEVIVVDDGSPVELEAVVEPRRARLPVHLVRQANAGPAAARNTGAALARGRFLAFTDDDCAPAPAWLAGLERRLLDRPDALVGGLTRTIFMENACAIASQWLIDYLCVAYTDATGQPHFFASNNLALATARFHEIGGFDSGFPRAAGEDREFCDRWSRADRPLIYAPEALVFHAHWLTLRSFWRQHVAYGRGALTYRLARSRHTQEPVRIESAAFYLNLVRYPFGRARGRRAATVAALLLLAQMANATGFVWEAACQRRGGQSVPRQG